MRLLRSMSIAVALLVVVASSLLAQAGVTVNGTVTSDQGVPLAGATVLLQGTNIGAQANDAGHFAFVVPSSRANGQSATLIARVIGYTASFLPITLSAGSTISHDFTLAVNPFHLGEVVVTGAGTSTTRERLTTTINTVDSSALRRAVQPQNLVSALAAQAPNVEVRTQSGEPGASASIRIRGATSLSGANQPLFIVDGQPIDNSTTSTQGGNQGTVTTNRAADINPEDIGVRRNPEKRRRGGHLWRPSIKRRHRNHDEERSCGAHAVQRHFDRDLGQTQDPGVSAAFLWSGIGRSERGLRRPEVRYDAP